MAGKGSTRDRRIGRPPAGARRGERVRDYPQISIRLPLDARAKLSALANVTGLTRWRLIVKALDRVHADLSPEEQRRVRALLSARREPQT